MFWTGVSCLVDWFFSALSLHCFDASTDTLVRVSNTTAMLFKDNTVYAHVCVCVCVCVCECVRVCVVGRDSEPNNVAATPASGPQPVESWCQADKHTRTRSHPRAHTLQKISVTFSLALSQSFPVIYCISCGLGAEMAHYVGCVSVYVCVCARMCMRVSVCMYECD